MQNSKEGLISFYFSQYPEQTGESCYKGYKIGANIFIRLCIKIQSYL